MMGTTRRTFIAAALGSLFAPLVPAAKAALPAGFVALVHPDDVWLDRMTPLTGESMGAILEKIRVGVDHGAGDDITALYTVRRGEIGSFTDTRFVESKAIDGCARRCSRTSV